MILSMAVLIAEWPFRKLIWQPALTTTVENSALMDSPIAWKHLAKIGVLGLFILLGADLLAQAGQIAGETGLSTFLAQIGRILLQTRLGSIWLFRLSLALSIGWLTFHHSLPGRTWSRFGIALLLIFTMSLTSHAAAESHPVVPVLVDWLHKVAVSVWIGGLAYFILAMGYIRPIEGVLQTNITSRLITHFSKLALICVSVAGLSGLYTAVLRVGSFPALIGTLYGQALLVKLAMAACLLALGAVNLLILSPRLKKDRSQSLDNPIFVNRFKRVIQTEVVMGILVMLSASLLASLPPAVVTVKSTDQIRKIRVDDLQEELTISPARVGINTFSLQLNSGGQPVILAKEVTLRFSAGQQNLPPSDLQMVSQGNGVYVAKGSNLSLPGNWQIQIIVRRENTFDAYANLSFDFHNPTKETPNQQNGRIAGGLVILIGLGYGLLIVKLHPSRIVRIGLGGTPLAVMIVLGLFFLTLPPPSNQSLVNPIAPNQDSIMAGKDLFTSHCAACHGSSGKGDGPAGLLMNPRPADLSLHAVPGVHTDAQLFQWISNGYPGTQMPAFRTQLSDTERWNLVNFIRTLASN